MSGLVTILKKHLYFGGRYLLRDNILCSARVDALLAHEKWSKEELAEYQRGLLAKTLRAAQRNIGAYQRLSPPADHQQITQFLSANYPVVTKTKLLRERERYYPRGGAARPWTIVGKTSGTTGTPIDMFRSIDSVLWEQAFIKRHWQWSGFKEGMRRATLRGDNVVPIARSQLPFWFLNRFNNQLLISSRHLKPAYMGHIVEALRKFQPHILQAYPSTVFVLARYLEETDGRLSVPYVYTGSEMLYPYQREIIEARIGKIMDFYGMAERVAYAAECEYGSLHVCTDYSYVEILDDDSKPTDDYGYVVGTTLHNLAMPLIRYRLSDRTRWKRGECACGRPYPMIEPIAGKFEDRVFGSDGSPVSPSIVTFAFKGVRNIASSQVAQVAAGRWEVRVVPMRDYSTADGEQIVRNIHELVDRNLNINVKVINEIPRTEAGKYRWVVNEWKGGAAPNVS